MAISYTDSHSRTSQNDLMAFGRSFFIVRNPIVMVCNELIGGVFFAMVS